MKLLINIILVLLVTSSNLAQYNGVFSDDVYKKKKKYPGYVILNNGDTLGGYIKAKDPVANEKNVDFFENEEDKKPTKEYTPKELKGYGFAHLNYITMNYSGGLTSKALRFVLIVKNGSIKECIWYDLEESMILASQQMNQTAEEFFNLKFPSKLIYYKDGEKPVTGDDLLFSFVKKIGGLTSDYSELSKKIANKEKGYKVLNINKIIDEYNEWAKNK